MRSVLVPGVQRVGALSGCIGPTFVLYCEVAPLAGRFPIFAALAWIFDVNAG